MERRMRRRERERERERETDADVLEIPGQPPFFRPFYSDSLTRHYDICSKIRPSPSEIFQGFFTYVVDELNLTYVRILRMISSFYRIIFLFLSTSVQCELWWLPDRSFMIQYSRCQISVIDTAPSHRKFIWSFHMNWLEKWNCGIFLPVELAFLHWFS